MPEELQQTPSPGQAAASDVHSGMRLPLFAEGAGGRPSVWSAGDMNRLAKALNSLLSLRVEPDGAGEILLGDADSILDLTSLVDWFANGLGGAAGGLTYFITDPDFDVSFFIPDTVGGDVDNLYGGFLAYPYSVITQGTASGTLVGICFPPEIRPGYHTTDVMPDGANVDYAYNEPNYGNDDSDGYSRTASWGTNTELEAVTPPILAGQVVAAVRCQSDLTVTVAGTAYPVNYMLYGPRAWAAESSGTNSA